MDDKRPDVYLENRRRVFRASSFGACDGALVRAAVGIEPTAKPEFLKKAMADSASHEVPILAELASQFGWKMLDGLVLEQYGQVGADGQLELELDVPGRTGGIVRCHPDGIGQCFRAKLVDKYKVTDRVVVEVKAMKGTHRDVLGGSEFYRWQTSIEMAVTGLPLLFVVGWKNDDGTLKRHEDGRINMTVAYLTEPYYTRTEINVRMRRLNRAIDTFDDGGGLPECTWPMFPCGYYPDHDRTTGVWMDKTVELKGAVAAKLRRYAKLHATQRGVEEEAKAARVELGEKMLAVLQEAGMDAGTYNAGQGVVVTRVAKAGSKRLDKSKVADAGIDLEPYYTTGDPIEYVTVKVEDQ